MIPAPASFAFELTKGVATITLDRPKRLKALTLEVYREPAEWFERRDSYDEVRAIVITGRGPPSAPSPASTRSSSHDRVLPRRSGASGPARWPSTTVPTA